MNWQTFQLVLLFSIFLNQALFSQSTFSDFPQAMMVCNNNPISFAELEGNGVVDESELGFCNSFSFKETNSVWLKWKVAQSGKLVFTILPFQENDDIDFVIYKLKDLQQGMPGERVRCMQAGPSLGVEKDVNKNCLGATGLQQNYLNVELLNGCNKGSDNFLAPLEVLSGESYIMVINNYKSSHGFTLHWGEDIVFDASSEDCSGHVPETVTSISVDQDSFWVSDPYPNPGSSIILIDVKSPKPNEGTIQIISSMGAICEEKSFFLVQGNNALTFASDELPRGGYFVRVRTKECSKLLRFIKQ